MADTDSLNYLINISLLRSLADKLRYGSAILDELAAHDSVPSVSLNTLRSILSDANHDLQIVLEREQQDELPEGMAQILDLMSKRFSQKAGEQGHGK